MLNDLPVDSSPLIPLDTDERFSMSPDAGLPECKCSRCGQLIGEEQVPIRVWPQDGSDTEYRYCEGCQAAAGLITIDSLDDLFEPGDTGP